MNEGLCLEEVELEILEVLNAEGREMRAGEVSAFIDKSYQLVGRRTSKLQENDLVEKNAKNAHTVNKITERAKKIYFEK